MAEEGRGGEGTGGGELEAQSGDDGEQDLVDAADGRRHLRRIVPRAVSGIGAPRLDAPPTLQCVQRVRASARVCARVACMCPLDCARDISSVCV